MKLGELKGKSVVSRQRILDIKDVVGVGAGLVTARESPPAAS